MLKGRPTRVCWDHYPEAIRLFLRGATLGVASRIALVVGTWLSLINQGSAISHGSIPWVKVTLNYLTPFTVSSIGFLAARRRVTLERLWAQLHAEAPGDARSAPAPDPGIGFAGPPSGPDPAGSCSAGPAALPEGVDRLLES